MSSNAILVLMALVFLGLGYMGVPVAFALMGGVLVATSLTPISFQSIIGQLYHGIDSETLLAIPFFLLVGELMTSSEVTQRMIRLAQALVGHLRGGLAQVVTLFSMFFAGISGSSAADVAVLSRTVAPEMDKEKYDRAFTAALIASASTIANLIPPSIMAVVYGATGNVSIGGLFLAGVVPGVMIGIGLMVYSYFFGPTGHLKPRAPLVEIFAAARGSALPMVIPVLIMGGILTGWFTRRKPAWGRLLHPALLIRSCGRRTSAPAVGFHVHGLLYRSPGGRRGALSLRLDAGLPARPDTVAEYIQAYAGTDARMIMCCWCCCSSWSVTSSTPCRPSSFSCPSS